MSLHENTPEGERTAESFHLVCAAVGLAHLVLGAFMLAWHIKGAADHRENRELLEARKR
jgi:hypothetical protein